MGLACVTMPPVGHLSDILLEQPVAIAAQLRNLTAADGELLLDDLTLVNQLLQPRLALRHQQRALVERWARAVVRAPDRSRVGLPC